MRLIYIFLVFFSLFKSSLVISQEQAQLDFLVHLASPLNAHFKDNGINRLIEADYQLCTLPFIELRHSKLIREKLRFGIGLFAFGTKQRLNYDLFVIESARLNIAPINYRLSNLRTGLSPSVEYSNRRWQVNGAIGASIGHFSHNLSDTFIQTTHLLTQQPNGTHWRIDRSEELISRNRILTDWYYSLGLAYQLSTSLKVNAGIFGFGSFFGNRRDHLQYVLNVRADLAESSGGMVVNNAIEILRPDHFWQIGAVLTLWNSD